MKIISTFIFLHTLSILFVMKIPLCILAWIVKITKHIDAGCGTTMAHLEEVDELRELNEILSEQ